MAVWVFGGEDGVWVWVVERQNRRFSFQDNVTLVAIAVMIILYPSHFRVICGLERESFLLLVKISSEEVYIKHGPFG